MLLLTANEIAAASTTVNPRNGKYRPVYLGWKSAIDQWVRQAKPSVPNTTGENRPAASGETKATFLKRDALGSNFEVAHLQKKKSSARPQKGYVKAARKKTESMNDVWR